MVDSAFISSPLWQRDKKDPQYAAFVQNIGQDKITPVTMADGQTLIPLNNHSNANSHEHFQLQSTTDFDELINFVYPDITEDARLWNDRAILATTNATIDKFNESISSRRPGQSVSFFSSDSLLSDESNPNTAFAAPEHLHNLLMFQASPRTNLNFNQTH